jgi:hypothetical protein
LFKKDFLRKENLCDKSDSKERELTKKEDKDRKNRTGGKTTRIKSNNSREERDATIQVVVVMVERLLVGNAFSRKQSLLNSDPK